MGDLNMNYDFPRDEWEETIVKALDELNLIDTACRFKLRTPRRTPTRVRWTWSPKGGGQQYYLQPDYCMARKRDMQHIKGVDFWSPRYLHSDHRTVVATIKMGRGRRLKVSVQAPEISADPTGGTKGRQYHPLRNTSSQMYQAQKEMGPGGGKDG